MSNKDVNLVTLGVVVGIVTIFGASAHCSHLQKKPAEIPNLVQVRQSDARGSAVWRSGCPDPSSWPDLARRGITVGIQLSSQNECDTSAAAAAGITIVNIPIPPSTIFDGWLGAVAEAMKRPDEDSLHKIRAQLGLIRDDRLSSRGRLIFCVHGQDRTGLVSAWTRLVIDGWDVDRSREEMIRLGYHAVVLVGLEEDWTKIVRDPDLTHQ